MSACRGQRDLLAEDRAHGQFDGIAVSGRTHPRMPVDESSESCRAQSLGDRHGIRIEIEDPPGPGHGTAEITGVRQSQSTLDEVSGCLSQRDDRRAVCQAHGSGVGAVGNGLDSRHGTHGVVGQEVLEVEGRTVGEAEDQLVGDGTVRSCGAQLSRADRIHVSEGVVELTDAGESRGEGDLAHRQRRGFDEGPGRAHPFGPGQRQRSGAELLVHEARQLSGTVAEFRGQGLDSPAVDDAFADEAHGPGDDITACVPFGEFGLASGRHRLQARKPASAAAAALMKKSTFSRLGVLAGHDGRQKIPVVCTAVKNMPSKRLSREVTA